MLTHDVLMKLTEHMPMKQIDVGGLPYLQRYYAGATAAGASLWLHRFIRGDGDRHLHNHPWQGRSYVLVGRYVEHFEGPHSSGERVREPCGIGAADLADFLMHEEPEITLGARHQMITPFTWHRITEAQPDTWTLMVVERGRLPMWWFRDDDGNLEAVTSSPEDWWKSCNSRAETRGAAL